MSRRKSKKKEEVIETMTDEILEVNEVEETTEPVEEIEVLEEPVEEEVVEEPVEEEVVKFGKVTAKQLNVRQEPSATAPVLLVVNQNDTFKIVNDVEDYYYVQINDDLFGYCKKDFIKECE